MGEGVDFNIRLGLLAACAFIGIIASAAIFRLHRAAYRRELFGTLALYAAFLLGDFVPLIQVMVSGVVSRGAFVASAAIYIATLLAAIALAKRGWNRMVVALTAALIIKWVLYALFTWGYDKIIA